MSAGTMATRWRTITLKLLTVEKISKIISMFWFINGVFWRQSRCVIVIILPRVWNIQDNCVRDIIICQKKERICLLLITLHVFLLVFLICLGLFVWSFLIIRLVDGQKDRERRTTQTSWESCDVGSCGAATSYWFGAQILCCIMSS